MRLSDLLGAPVVDRDGRRVGRVIDVRLVQDGPVQFPYGAALRLDGLIVGERSGSRLLGYERDVRPAPLRWLVHVASGTVRFVDFDRVERREDGTVQTHEPVDQLPLLDDVPARR